MNEWLIPKKNPDALKPYEIYNFRIVNLLQIHITASLAFGSDIVPNGIISLLKFVR